jgi:hypothetical protein
MADQLGHAPDNLHVILIVARRWFKEVEDFR